MSYYRTDPRGPGFLSGSSLSTAVRMLIAWNVILFLGQQLIAGRWPEIYFGLVPVLVWRGYVWQLVTYMFLHGGLVHILFNMIALWMFGSDLERLWGTRRFVKYYFFTGIGGGLLTVVTSPGSPIPTIGASAAVFGLLLAYGVTFPNRAILLYFIFPIRAKYFVMIYGAIEFFASISGAHSGIAHVAHLGGLIFGWIFLRGFPGQGLFRRYRRRRERGRFKVLEFNDRDDDR